MIDRIDLSHWSVSQLCEFHNHVLASGCNVNGHGYNYHYDANDQLLEGIKKTLIDINACSIAVLDYRGKL